MPRLARLPNIAPARLDIDLYRGDTFTMRVKIKTHGVPINISAWQFRAYVRGAIEDELEITYFTVNLFNPLTGDLRLALGSDQTAILPESTVWDLEAMDAYLRVRTILRGHISTLADVTYDFIEA